MLSFINTTLRRIGRYLVLLSIVTFALTILRIIYIRWKQRIALLPTSSRESTWPGEADEEEEDTFTRSVKVKSGVKRMNKLIRAGRRLGSMVRS